MGKYSGLTIDELKKELVNCKNKPIKEKNIKKELEKRYNEYIIDELLMNVEFNNGEEEENNKNEEGEINVDPKYQRFIVGDVANNKLLERMNSEVFLHQQQKNKKKNMELLKPYANDEGNYASIDNLDKVYTKIPNNDFTNNRLIGQRRQIHYN